MKKRIFIAMHYLEIGGAETSLIGLLHSIDYEKYDVDLFLYAHRGEMMKFIPKQVHLLPEETAYKYIESPILDTLKSGHIGIALARLWAKIQYASYARRNSLSDGSAIYQYIQDAVCPFLPSLKKYGEYDLAISYLTPHRIVLEKVQAKKKIAWIHTDYSQIKINVQRELPIWQAYDQIASISEDVTKAFLKLFPMLESKILLFENILSKEMIVCRAEEQVVKFPTDGNRKNLLSIGRFSYAKNYDNVPDICRRIRQKGMNIYWYIIGYGGDEALIRQKIQETEMEDYVILLGKKENPYPYIKACDFYMQPSRYEGKSVTVREAQLLGKPVVIANYPTAHSQVEDGIDGIIVPQGNEECAQKIVEFLSDREIQQEISRNINRKNYTNIQEICKLYRILN